jgi:hypothetical protein
VTVVARHQEAQYEPPAKRSAFAKRPETQDITA